MYFGGLTLKRKKLLGKGCVLFGSLSFGDRFEVFASVTKQSDGIDDD